MSFAPNMVSASASEWTVLPYFRSPTSTMFRPSMDPLDLFIVNRSSSVCVGCEPAPSPALMTGFSDTLAASLAAPSWGCLRTIASQYVSTMRIVSARVSPLAMDVADICETSMTLIPSLYAALSKESLVLVDGSKKRLPRILPSRGCLTFSPLAYGTMVSARSMMYSISFLLKSLIETTSLSKKFTLLLMFGLSHDTIIILIPTCARAHVRYGSVIYVD